jgi:hypothetical protein
MDLGEWSLRMAEIPWNLSHLVIKRDPSSRVLRSSVRLAEDLQLAFLEARPVREDPEVETVLGGEDRNQIRLGPVLANQ